MSTIIEKHQAFKKNSALAIRPFINDEIDNMGLEKYNMVLFESVFHEEPLMCLEYNGIKRYVTGLNEFAPEIKNLPDEEREAAIKEIRTIVASLERDLASNVVKIDDENFWDKVKLLNPANDEFWDKIVMRFGNEPVFLDPANDPYDLIKLKAIEAGGFSLVFKSLNDARANGGQGTGAKFYLDKYVDTVSTKTEVSKLKNKAISELTKLFDKNQNKLFYIAKVVDANSVQYKKSTPNDVIYDNMDKYITGRGVESNLTRAAQTFIDASGFDMETLKIKALIKDSTYYKFIIPKSDGFIYHTETSSLMGRNAADCLEFLKNPLNDSILLNLTKTVEKYWNM